MQYAFATIVLACCLIGAGCVQMPNSAPRDSGIDSESVSGTRLDLSNRGLSQVPQDVFRQTDITELDISGNNLTGAIPGEIRLLTELQVLDLSNNEMTGLPAEVGQLGRLRVLDLSDNRLTGLPLELGNLSKLEVLDLRGNPYSEHDLGLIRERLVGVEILVD